MKLQWIYVIVWWYMLMGSFNPAQAQRPTPPDSSIRKPNLSQEIKDYLRPIFKWNRKKITEAELRQQLQPNFGLYFYPLSLFAANLTIGGEFKLGFRTSIRAIGSYGASPQSRHYRVDDMNRGYLEAQFRYYPIRFAMKSLYFMGFGYAKAMRYRMNNLNQSISQSGYDATDMYDIEGLRRAYGVQPGNWSNIPVLSGSLQGFGCGVATGFHIVFFHRVVADLYSGVAFQLAYRTGEADRWMKYEHPIISGFGDNFQSKINPHLGFSLGFLFY